MFEVKYDSIKNRIYIKAAGFMQKEEAIRFREECVKANNMARKGATFLMDAREMKTLPPESMEEVQKIREHSIKVGCVKGAMIVANAILKMQSGRTGKQIPGFIEEYFSTIEEAEKFLDVK